MCLYFSYFVLEHWYNILFWNIGMIFFGIICCFETLVYRDIFGGIICCFETLVPGIYNILFWNTGIIFFGVFFFLWHSGIIFCFENLCNIFGIMFCFQTLACMYNHNADDVLFPDIRDNDEQVEYFNLFLFL